MESLQVSRIRARAAEIWKEGGATGLLFAILAELGYRRLIIRESSLRGLVVPVTARIPLELGQLDPSMLDAYNRLRRPSDPESAAKRLAKGDQCFVGWHEDRIVGACWLSTGSAWSVFLSAPVHLAPDEAYSYDLFTDPSWRGNGVPAAITSFMHRHCKQNGFNRVIGFTIPENRPAMTRSLGYRSIGVIGSAGLGRFRRQFCRVNPGMRAPGQAADARPYWDETVSGIANNGYYLDDFLARMKRDAYLDLIRGWGCLPANGRLLKTDLFEEAMGPDAFLLDLDSPSTTLVGMDISAEAAKRGQLRDPCRKAAYVAADARALPFRDQTMNIVISPSTLDHFPEAADLAISLKELRRVIAPGGRLLITLDNRQNIFDPLLRLVKWLGRIPYFLGQSYTVRELREQLREAGFDIVETTAIVHHPRLMGVVSIEMARRIGLPSVRRSVEQALLGLQKLRGSRLRYFSGCFVAALATPSVMPAKRETAKTSPKAGVA